MGTRLTLLLKCDNMVKLANSIAYGAMETQRKAECRCI